MTGLGALIRRNCKLFFKDKGMFFTSLITPVILLVLYATFLAKVYRDSFAAAMPAGFAVDAALIDGTVGGQLVSSLLAVCCVTVAFCSNLLMVQDRISGARRDLTMTPVRRSTLALGYFAASALSTLLICYAALAVCLLGGWNIAGLIPAMPYWCGAILALSFAALTVLLVVSCVYYAAFLRQLVRSFGRFQHNALASASGEAVLPALAINPQFSAKTRRRLRAIALISLALFAACFVLSYVVCALSAGSFQFWHAWGWFRN